LARRKQRISKEVSKLVKEVQLREGDERWLGSASARVLRTHYGKYVAVKKRKILASSPTMKGLYEKLDKLNLGMVLITRIDDWEKVMAETGGSWAEHPVFGEMKNSVEIVHWLRSQR
jgi:hypothetical protein